MKKITFLLWLILLIPFSGFAGMTWYFPSGENFCSSKKDAKPVCLNKSGLMTEKSFGITHLVKTTIPQD